MQNMGFDGAVKLSAQTAEWLRTCATLQTESASQILDESIRVSKVVLGDGEARSAITQWGRIWEQAFRGYFETTRSLQESALMSQSEMIKAAGTLFTAGNKLVAENLEQVTREVREQQAKPQAVGQQAQQGHKRAA
jgi:hypothetical protein